MHASIAHDLAIRESHLEELSKENLGKAQKLQRGSICLLTAFSLARKVSALLSLHHSDLDIEKLSCFDSPISTCTMGICF
jgi:hypothetical protein